MIKKIVVDGNDGTGKSYRIEQLKKLFPNITFEDRGIFSKATLDDDLFDDKKNESFKFCFVATPREKFYNSIKMHSDTLYIVLDASIETCQKRILERGDSLDCEFHNEKDLRKYKERFNLLVDLCRGLPNVMLVNTD